MALNFASYPPNFNEIGTQFLQQYYQSLQTSKDSLAPYFHDQALMSYEGVQLQGKEAILQKFKSMPWNTLAVAVTNADFQPIESGVLIFVNGQLKCDEDRPLSFSESFVLKKFGESFCITNCMFRLGLHNF